MDIEEFYDADPRRRASAEVELGREWYDARGVRHELSWVVDTGELYVMCEPAPREWGDPFGGVHVTGVHETDESEVVGMTVSVVGSIATHDELDRILDGWQAAMAGPDGVGWLRDRLKAEGVAATAADSPRPASA